MSFTFVNFIPSQRSTVTSKFVRRSSDLNTNLEGGYTQASVTFYGGFFNDPAFRITALPSFLRGRRSNWLNFGVFLHGGGRYFCTLFGDDGVQYNGNISTAGGSGGYGSTDSGAIVSKINSTALNQWISAELIQNMTEVDYTGAAGVGAGDAVPLVGGRG